MNRDYSVVCFCEDVAHENFIKTLVQRAAREVGIPVRIEMRNATHGSRVWRELEDYIKDVQDGSEPIPDILVVVIDGNCKKAREVRREILNKIWRHGPNLPTDHIVCAVPEPHIERWYLEDQRALALAIPGAQSRKFRYKCERGRYKHALAEAIRASGIEPLLGGAEYGADVANRIGPERVDRSFRSFWNDLRRILLSLRRV